MKKILVIIFLPFITISALCYVYLKDKRKNNIILPLKIESIHKKKENPPAAVIKKPNLPDLGDWSITEVVTDDFEKMLVYGSDRIRFKNGKVTSIGYGVEIIDYFYIENNQFIYLVESRECVECGAGLALHLLYPSLDKHIAVSGMPGLWYYDFEEEPSEKIRIYYGQCFQNYYSVIVYTEFLKENRGKSLFQIHFEKNEFVLNKDIPIENINEILQKTKTGFCKEIPAGEHFSN